MQTANILLALGGDSGNTVPKYGVTPAEIEILRAIHGEAAVTEIDVLEDNAVADNGKARTNRQELARLNAEYGGARDPDGNSLVQRLYPGAGARVNEQFDELELDDSLYVAKERAAPAKKSEAEDPADDKPLDDMTKAELVAEAKKRGVEVDTAAPKATILEKLKAGETAQPVENDGIGDMSGSVLS